MFCDPTEGVVAIPQQKLEALTRILPGLAADEAKVQMAIEQGGSIYEAFKSRRPSP